MNAERASAVGVLVACALHRLRVAIATGALVTLAALAPAFATADRVALRGGCDASNSAELDPAPGPAAISHCGGDAWTGRIELQLQPGALRDIEIVTTGFVGRHGVTLTISEPSHTGLGPWSPIQGHSWQALALPARLRDQAVTLVLEDNSSDVFGWGGIAVRPRSPLEGSAAGYATFLVRTAAIAALLFLPGVWWRALRFRGHVMPVHLLFLPGLLVLTAAGLLAWTLPASGAIVGWTLIAGSIVAGIDALRRIRRGKWSPTGRRGRLALVVYALVVAQAFASGLNPRPVAQEYAAGTAIPGRMIASPPDHLIPYQTATYMARGLDGIEDSDAYFGAEWNIGSRGPLVPLGINSLFRAFGEVPADDPPGLGAQPWPIPTGTTGTEIARAYGWLTNGLLVLAAAGLLATLGVGDRAYRVALVWLALTPLVFINTVFLWPKLLAGGFLLLAFASALQRRWLLAGAFGAAGWLSHPIGALFLPSLALLALLASDWRTRPANAVKAVGQLVAAVLAIMAPWLAYKAQLGQPDAFLGYILGDGRGFVAADSFRSWILARWDNLLYTFVPGAFFASDAMHLWLQGPLSEPLRWAIQSAKSVPGMLGLVTVPLLCAALFVRKPLPGPRTSTTIAVVGAGTVVALVFWGYSHDGLGRNCIEPIAVVALLLVCAQPRAPLALLAALLPVVALESKWVEWSGLINTASGLSGARSDTIACLVVGAAVSIGLVAIGLRGIRLDDPDTRTECTPPASREACP